VDDQFGGDPQVRYLRKVFAGMEKKQNELLALIGVSTTDYRLRRVREGALKSFEKAWMIASRRGALENVDEIGDLYILCLAKVLSGNRILVPDELLPSNTGMKEVIKEVFT
jgi:hypothetical protein